MNKEVITFSDIYIEKRKFHNQKHPILMDDAGIDEIITNNKVKL